MLVYTITKGNNKSYVYDIYHGIQGPQGIQGEQGIQGIQGVPGTAATISVGNVTSGSTPSVTNVGTSNAAIFDFVLEKGDKGDQGPVGQAAGFGTPTASATSLTPGSEPTASVVASGDSTQKVFAFSFGIPKGDKGDQGIQGIQGETGPAAGFGTPTASATLLPSGSNPTASVTASGADTSKVFAFNFGIPAGDTNVQADWNQTDTTADDYIKNKPSMPDTWAITHIYAPYISDVRFKVYKNGAEYTSPIKYRYFTVMESRASTSTLNSSLTLNYDTNKQAYVTNFGGNDQWIGKVTIELWNDADTGVLTSECIGFFPKALTIANEGEGYTTSDQVYDYVAAQVGNINTILQSI